MYGCRTLLVERGRGVVLDEEAGVHDGDAVADRGGELEVVRDEEQAQTPLAALLVEDRHDLRLRRHVERGRRLVGEQQARLDGEGGGDHDPLQQTAGELVRVLVQAALGVVDADVAEEADDDARRLAGVDAVVGDQRLGQEVPDLAHGIDVRGRVLEDHRRVGGPEAPQGLLAEAEHVGAVEDGRRPRRRSPPPAGAA